MKVYCYSSPLYLLGLIQISLENLPGKTIKNLLDKTKAEIYSARYTLVDRKEPA